MANSEVETSSDATRALGGEYQVFLSFRGLDTRHGFTDFLYRDLINAGVRVFRDEDELQEGEVIGDNLLHAIDNSILYIPIFSRNYISSKWCLRELALMANNVSKSEGQKSIIPIFFDVEPEDVKLKTPLYSDALLEHEKKFPDEVNNWRKALEEVDEIKGWNVKSSQAKIVESVVEKVLEKLETKQKLVPKDLIGLDDRVKHLTELSDVNHHDVRLIAIYGMGGIGKTTVAKVVFNQLSSHFGKCCSFVDDIRKNSLNKEGMVQLQKKLLFDIVGSKSAEQFKESEKGMRRIGETLCSKKVLVVLDDVSEEQHIEKLLGNYSLRSGSRIIITTRDKTIPPIEGFNGNILRYEMLKMDDALALQLFCRHAFGRDFPSDGYQGLSREIISSTGGLPLAIEVVGSLLKDKEDKIFWEEILVKLREVPNKEIVEKLRISYNDLDEFQKKIFLDIACFFFNEKKTDAMYMWESCKFYPKEGIEVLTKRCLIKILYNDKFWMHDQLIALGRQIVREDSLGDLGKQSRLWIEEEALQIIRTKERKYMVEALEVFGPITNEDFERLPNLRFLKLNSGTYAGDFARCHSNIRSFSWYFPSAKDFGANNLYLDRLVVCKLCGIKFKDDSKAWDLIKRARNLKVLSFTKCSGITTIPDISKCSGLERLTLVECSNLKRIESFIGDLQSLIELKIEKCKNFTDLPEEVGELVKLKHFSLAGCSGLGELPCLIGNSTSLTELNLSDTKIKELPKFIGKLKSLRILRCEKVGKKDHVWQFPSDINMLVNLEELRLLSSYVGGEIPVELGNLSSLRILELSGTSICGIPRTINMLHHLQALYLWDCDNIRELPELPSSLTELSLDSKSLLSVPNLSNLTNLVYLYLKDRSGNTRKSNLITRCNLWWIGSLSRLKRLELNLLNVPAPPELASLSHLEDLDLSCLDLKPLVQLPSSDWRLRNLSKLDISMCEVEDIPLNGLPLLECLDVHNCKLQRLSIPLELTKLRLADVSDCPELVEIQVMGLSKSLEILEIDNCESLTKICGLSYLKILGKLKVKKCNGLTDVEGLNELESLRHLEIRECTSLRRLINASGTSIPDDCSVQIQACGDFIKDAIGTRQSPMSLKRYKEVVLSDTSSQLKSTSAKQGKRKRDDDHASQTNTTTKNSTCGPQSGIPQHVTRMTRSQAAKIQPPVEVAALPAKAVGPSRKKKKNDSKQVNPIRRSARLMKGPTGGTSDMVHLD